jgi:hypothetical protein
MKYSKLFLYSGLMTVALVNCKDPDYGSPSPSTTVNYAHVLYINAAPDAGSQVFLLNNAPAATQDAITASAYVNTVGNAQQFRVHNVKFGVVGTDTLAAKSDLVLQSTLAGGTSYTLILTDTLARPFTKGKSFSTNQGGLQFLGPITDVLTTLPADTAGARFLNLAPGAPSVYLTDNGATLSTLSNSRSYRTTTNFTAFVKVVQGSHSLEVRTGSTSGPIIATLATSFTAGKHYTIFLSGEKVGSIVKVPYMINVVQYD